MDVDSEASEGFEDFHPSSLLEVIVKETESPMQELKIENESLSVPTITAPTSLLHSTMSPSSLLLQLNQNANLSTHFLAQHTQKSTQDEDWLKKGETPKYWRICYLCNTKEPGGKDNPLAFHKFPAEMKLCKQWKKACNLDNRDDVANLKICSKHFKPEDYVDSRAKLLGGLLKLKQGAVPSLLLPSPNPMVFHMSENKKFILLACSKPGSPVAASSSRVTEVPSVALKQMSGGVVIKTETQIPGDIKTEISSTVKPSFVPVTVISSPTSAVKVQQSHQTSKDKKDDQVPYWRRCFLCNGKEPGGRESKLAFHKFPADTKACNLWKQVCNLTDIDDVSTLKLCSKHFHPEDYIDSRAKELGGHLKLKSGTVPSIAVPNPLSSRNAPTKYFIVTNSIKKSGGSLVANGTQPTRLLNVVLPEAVATSAVGTATVPTPPLIVPASGKVPNVKSTASASNSALVSTLVKLQQNAKQSVPPSLPPDKNNSKPVLISSPNSIQIKQPRVVIQRLNMSSLKDMMKGQLKEQQLSKKKNKVEDLNKTKSGSSSEKPIEEISIDSLTKKKKSIEDIKISSLTKKKSDKESEKDRAADERIASRKTCFICGKGPGRGVTLHSFPTDLDLRQQWRRVCGLQIHDSVFSLRICSQHFKSEDFYEDQLGLFETRIKPRVVPSLNIAGLEFPKNISETSAKQLEENPDFHPPKFLEVLVNESAPPTSSSDDEDVEEITNTDESNKTSGCCFLCGSKEGSSLHSPVAMHKFPCDQNTNRLWKQVCNVYEHDYMNTSSLLICSNHFVAKDYVDGNKLSGGLPILKSRAVPSVLVPNPLKVMALSTLASIEPENSVNSDDFNPSDLMAVTFNEPGSPEAALSNDMKSQGMEDPLDDYKMNVVDCNVAATGSNNNNNNNNDGSSLTSHSLLKCVDPEKKTEINRQYHHCQSSPKEPNDKVFPSIKIRNLHQRSRLTPVLNSQKGASSPADQGRSDSVISFSRQLLNTVNNMANTKPGLLENLLHSGQTLKIIRNPQQPGNNSAQTVQIMPPLKLAVAPPGLFLPTQSLKKSVNMLDQSSQTLVPMISADQSCQTESAECSMDLTDQDDESSVVTPPAIKRRRLSLPTMESTAPEGSVLKQCRKVAILRRHSHIQVLEQQMRRIKKRIHSLEDLLNHLQKRDLLSRDAADTLMSIVTHDCQELISRKLRARGTGKWPQILKGFVLTLHFYSVDAYNHVKSLWPNLVPDPTIMRTWLTVADAKPGFTQEVLDAIYTKSKDSKNGVLCNLMISEMQIQREIIYEEDRFYGGVDFGTYQDVQYDSTFEAQNALVFFVADLDKSWKAPVGYFLINTLNAKERANVLTKCLQLLNEIRVKVLSITMDTSSVNISMCTHLGANFSYGERFQPWFFNPVTREKMFVFWDPCSMMKFVRDCLGDKGILLDAENKRIKWSYIKDLHKVQSELNWEVDTKLTEAHIDYQENRADQKLSLQTLSRSVYKGFMKVLEKNMESFEGCYSTAVYCLMFNNIFDLLNCRNDFSKKKFHVPITDESVTSLQHSATVFIKYISSLKDKSGTSVLNTCRKTGFLGLIVCLTNIFSLFEEAKSLGLKRLLTHKLSLDYVRTFFSAMLGPGDESCFLNAKDFENGYRNLVLKSDVNFERPDCLVDGVDLLRVTALKEYFTDPICDYVDVTSVEWIDHEHFTAAWSLKPILGNVMKYISGFVVNKILRKRLCPVCAEHLTNEKSTEQLLRKRNQRKYIIPSKDVYRICSAAEVIFRENRIQGAEQSDLQFLVSKVFSRVCSFVFDNDKMKAHTIDQGTFDNHMTQLCKLVIETFLDIRIFHENEKVQI